MDHRFPLIAALLLFFFSGVASAGYANLQPPAGWSAGGTGNGGQFFGPAANSSQYLGNTVRTNAALNVGGRMITVPASLRFAQNAPRIAAGLLFANPALRTGLAIASWIGVTQFVWDEVTKQWVGPSENSVISSGYEYRVLPSLPWSSSKYDACQSFGTYQATQDAVYGVEVGTYGSEWCVRRTPNDGYTEYYIDQHVSSCPAGWYVTPAGCTQTPQMQPVTQQEFEDGLLNPDNQPGWPGVPADWPMPQFVPSEIPFPLPIDLPSVNPGPAPNYNPRPFFIPQGDPVPNPNYDPNANPSPENQPYVRPGINVRPANSPNAPWNVDLQPVDRPSADDQSNPDPDMDGQQSSDKPRDPKETGLCDMYPDIAACQKLGDLDKVPVANKTVPLAINREEGFGPSEGTCPAPRQFTIMGKTMAFRWDLLCDFAQGVRPVIIGMAYLAAVLAFLGLSRKGS